MLSRNDQPNIPNFNFATTSVFNNIANHNDASVPILQSNFLLLETGFVNLLDGTQLLLLGS